MRGMQPARMRSSSRPEMHCRPGAPSRHAPHQVGERVTLLMETTFHPLRQPENAGGDWQWKFC